jgi:pimeloyl-ACP methyl ester carboxylesterase
MSLPVIGPRVIADAKGRYLRTLADGFGLPEEDVRLYVECMRQPGHAEAGSRWYRSFQTKEMLSWMRGEFDDARVDVPVRWLTGTRDPVITSDLTDVYADRISDFEVELVDDVGHWIVAQRPELVLDRIQAFLRLET